MRKSASKGAVLQQQLLDKARELGMNIWGPNSLGYNNVSARTPVSSVPAVLPLLPPRIAIVSQSGATASELNEFAHSQNIGTSFVAATGNEAQLSLADVIDYLVDDADTRAIAVFAESIRNPAVFAQAAQRCRERRKPIVMLKIGRSELAGEVAKAHTGSLAGDDKVFDAICARLGVIRVHSVEDLIVTAGLLAATGPLPASGLGFISISGGACTLVADGAEASGASVPAFPAETTDVLKTLIADFASSMNPLDVTGAAVRDPALLERLIPVAACRAAHRHRRRQHRYPDCRRCGGAAGGPGCNRTRGEDHRQTCGDGADDRQDAHRCHTSYDCGTQSAARGVRHRSDVARCW